MIGGVNIHDMIIVTGDMNAKFVYEYKDYERVVGKHGLGLRKENGERLCEICDMYELVITGALFPHKTIHKATWVSPDRRTRKQIDHILINKRFRKSVNDRVYRSADIGSHHYLVCTKIMLRLRKAPKEKIECRVKYNTAKLENEQVLKAFNITLSNRYGALENEEPEVEEEEEVERLSGDEEGIHRSSRNSIGKISKDEKAMDQQGVMGPHRSKRGR